MAAGAAVQSELPT